MIVLNGMRMIVGSGRGTHRRRMSVAMMSGCGIGRRHRQARRGAGAGCGKSEYDQNEPAETRSVSPQNTECVGRSGHECMEIEPANSDEA